MSQGPVFWVNRSLVAKCWFCTMFWKYLCGHDIATKLTDSWLHVIGHTWCDARLIGSRRGQGPGTRRRPFLAPRGANGMSPHEILKLCDSPKWLIACSCAAQFDNLRTSSIHISLDYVHHLLDEWTIEDLDWINAITIINRYKPHLTDRFHTVPYAPFLIHNNLDHWSLVSTSFYFYYSVTLYISPLLYC